MTIEAVWCEHCQMLSLLAMAKACRCPLSGRPHLVCRDCGKDIDPSLLGEIVVQA